MLTTAKLDGGDFADFAKEVGQGGAAAVTAAVSAATDTLKDAFRNDVANAALGEKLGRAIGSKLYPRSGASLGAAGIVYPRGAKSEAIFRAWNEGAVITARGGRKWLAIPTAAAGARGITPVTFRDSTGIALRFVPIRGKANVALLVGKGKRGREQVFFVLVKSTAIPARLHFEAIAQAVADQVPGLIERELR